VEAGDAPPNNWPSVFTGPAWTQAPDGEWYLHLFAPQQPDLNWEHPEVRAEFEAILRFWLDRGVDGIRIDVAHGLIKAPGLPDTWADAALLEGAPTPYWDQDGVHEIYRSWRLVLDAYQPERIAVAEAWLDSQQRMARYVRPDELHQSFNFELLTAPWDAATYRWAIDGSLAAMGEVGAPTTWVLSNHDVVRPATRLATGRPGAAGGISSAATVSAADPVVGLARARAAILLVLALPGSVYLYQGEELGLPEVLDLPAGARQDPIFARSGGRELGRDGCRVPLPWSGSAAPYGFGDGGAWLPQPESWARLSVAAQSDDPDSTLALYRRALRLRRELGLGRDEPVVWHSGPDDRVLIFERPGLLCAVNLGDEPASQSIVDGEPIVASGRLVAGVLPPDTAAWWRL
jgi:alpha-glucosidase